VLVRLAACAAVVLVGVGCGGADRRDAARDYIEQVNRVSRELRASLIEVQNVYSRFSTRRAELPALRPELERSERTILTLQSRLRNVDAPADARLLRRRLLLLVAAEAELAREAVSLVAFVPRLETALRRLRPATARLRALLRRAGNDDARAAALDAYSRIVAKTVRRLRRLRPPPVVRPSHAADVAALTRVGMLAGRLSNALRRRQGDVLPRLVTEFDRAAQSGATLSAQRAERRAVIAYNRRVARIGALAAAVEQERARLERALE
jgi:hypothetical protein